MKKYMGNNPKRRIAKANHFTEGQLNDFAGTGRYRGSPHHKSQPADYGFHPPASPRPSKSLCDDKRVIRLEEAIRLFKDGIARGMVSMEQQNDLPKYIWAQDEQGNVYEAKLGGDGRSYDGYRLRRDDRAMREWVINEWTCRNT